MGCVPGSVGCLGRLDQIVNKTVVLAVTWSGTAIIAYSYRYFFGTAWVSGSTVVLGSVAFVIHSLQGYRQVCHHF
jgi:hypothetical protein